MYVSLIFVFLISVDGCFAEYENSSSEPYNLVAQYINQEFQSVAVGFPMTNVSFKHVTPNESQSYTKNWHLQSIDESIPANVTFVTHKSKLGQLSCSKDNQFPPNNISNYEYEMKCSIFPENAVLYVNKKLSLNVGKRCVYIQLQGSSEIVGSVLLTVKYCVKPSRNGRKFLVINCPKNISFGEECEYSCDNGTSLMRSNNFSSNHTSHVRNCQFNATLNGKDDIICSYAATVNITILNVTGKDFFTETDNITVQCNVTDLGIPEATCFCYIIQLMHESAVTKCNDEMKQPIQLDRKLNNARITCQATNNYTNKNAATSHSVVLNVTFAPFSNDEHFSNVDVSDNSATLNFRFTANPRIYEDNILLTFSGNGTAVEKSLNVTDGQLIGDSPQTYTYIISPVTPANYGLYFLNISSSLQDFAPLVLTRNLSGEDFEIKSASTISSLNTTGNPAVTESQPIKAYVIVIPVVAGTLIVLLIIGYLLHKCRGERVKEGVKEQKENPVYESSPVDGTVDKEERINPIYGSSAATVKISDKEERVNPLYGSTAGAGPSTNKNKVKKERKNPLYVSSSDGNDVSEVTYAEIDKNKKKKGSENPSFTVETSADTYAEVKKPKKVKPDMTKPDETYAEARKVKGGKNDANLHGSENDAA